RPRLNAFDDLVDELLGADVEDARLGSTLQHGVRDRLHQVRLAQAGRAVDEERVVRFARRLDDGVGRGRGELVRLADDERVEAVALIERRRRGGSRGASSRRRFQASFAECSMTTKKKVGREARAARKYGPPVEKSTLTAVRAAE